MRLGIFLISYILLISSTKSQEIAGYKPWSFVPETPVLSDSFSRNYMDSRFPRIVENLTTDWTFYYSPENREDSSSIQPEYNDDTWEVVQIPHTWMTYETTGDLHPFIMYASENEDSYWWRGWGYYRKKIKIAPTLKDKRIFLEFDGVQKYCAVYVNGHKAGEHKGGFNSFSVDITKFIDWHKAEQYIAVTVNGYRRDKWHIPPMTAGNWDVYSGIYRPVRLCIKNSVYIPYQGNYEHEGGTFVTTPVVSNDSTIVQIKTFVKNDRLHSEKIKLITRIVDNKDSVLAELSESKLIQPAAIDSLLQRTVPLKNMKLWSAGNPVLYKVKSMVYIADSLMDSYESPLGVRTFFWDYNSNDLYVNGEKMNIRGINRHQEYPWLGDAIPEWLMLKDMADIKYGLGINFMRTAHYPQAPVIYDFNNQHGIITVEEVPNIKNIDFNDEVQEQNARAMIRRDRNNPCIFFWSIGNETSDAAKSEWVREEDSTRIIHARKAEGGGVYVAHTHLNLDMENLLRVTHRGWFNHDDVTPGINPVPENGQEAGSNLWQYEKAKINNGSIRGNLNHNCVIWLYQDHGADRNYKNSLLTALNAKGWVDMYRVPKSVYFLTRANYLENPVIYIHREFWRKKYEGKQKDIAIDSNCEEVELLINGKVLGRKKVSRDNFNSVIFENVKIESGELKAIGYVNNRGVIEQRVRLAEKPYRLLLKSSSAQLNSANEYIAVITAYIVDKKGTVVFDAAPPLEWEVDGEATLVGPSVYENDLGKKEARQGTGYEAIPVSNVIRGTARKGTVKVRVTSPSIKPAQIVLSNQGHPVVSECYIGQPILKTDSRKKVERDKNYKEVYEFSSLISTRLDDNTQFDISDTTRLRKDINDFLQTKEGVENLHGVGYNILSDQLVRIVKRMEGTLIGDDFNFLMEQYNLYLNIEQVIDGCLFHVDYSELLKKEYLKKIMIEHEQVDYAAVCSDILSYPRKCKVCYVEDVTGHTQGQMTYDYVTRTYTVYTSDKNCFESISKAFDIEADKKKTWAEIARITPFLTLDMNNGKIKFLNNQKIVIIPDEAPL